VPDAICRAGVVAPLLSPVNSIRQLVAFPPDDVAGGSSGLVRQRHLLLELESGAVYHLSVPCNWGPLRDRVALLAEAIRSHDCVCPHPQHIASVIGWALETQLTLVDLDLSAPTIAAWPVRAAAIPRCYMDSPPGESSLPLAERVALTEKEIGDAAGAALGNFVAGLNPDILALASLWGCMPWRRYNYFANAREGARG
jgi:hypothetical protein